MSTLKTGRLTLNAVSQRLSGARRDDPTAYDSSGQRRRAASLRRALVELRGMRMEAETAAKEAARRYEDLGRYERQLMVEIVRWGQEVGEK